MTDFRGGWEMLEVAGNLGNTHFNFEPFDSGSFRNEIRFKEAGALLEMCIGPRKTRVQETNTLYLVYTTSMFALQLHTREMCHLQKQVRPFGRSSVRRWPKALWLHHSYYLLASHHTACVHLIQVLSTLGLGQLHRRNF